MPDTTALHSHTSVCHYTPMEVISRAHLVFGGEVHLDPASDVRGNTRVNAGKIFTEEDDGLNHTWELSGHSPTNVFVNPPGRSDGNPGGASEWWLKATNEFYSHQVNIIFVGFSLELLQTCQTRTHVHPLGQTWCVPARRLHFAVAVEDRIRQLQAALDAAPLTNTRRRASLYVKIGEAEAIEAGGGQFMDGDSPTHGNIIVCLSRSPGVRSAFRYHFSPLGIVGGL